MDSRIILVTVDEATITTDVTPDQMTNIMKKFPGATSVTVVKKPQEYTYKVGGILQRDFKRLLYSVQCCQSFNLSKRQVDRDKRNSERCQRSTAKHQEEVRARRAHPAGA